MMIHASRPELDKQHKTDERKRDPRDTVGVRHKPPHDQRRLCQQREQEDQRPGDGRHVRRQCTGDGLRHRH
jgi:hypothetical protein